MNQTYGKIIGIVSLLLVAFALAISAISACFTTTWLDENITLAWIRRSYWEIVQTTAGDVHPPLYYWYVKFLCDIVALFNASSAAMIITGKFASVLPIVGILLYAFLFVRKRFGLLSATLFSLLITSMPRIMEYSVEIRMYSLSLFFVTAAYLHAYAAWKEQKTVHWVMFGLYSLFAAYTHYFALVSVGLIYIGLFFLLLFRQKRSLLPFFVSLGGLVLLYIPWLVILFRQFVHLNGHWWVDPVTLRDFIGDFNWFLRPAFFVRTKAVYEYLAEAIVIGLYLYVCIRYLLLKRKARETDDVWFLLIGAAMPILVIVIGFAVSLIFWPVFVCRFVMPALGAFWLVPAICAGKLAENAQKAPPPVDCKSFVSLSSVAFLPCAPSVPRWKFGFVSERY